VDRCLCPMITFTSLSESFLSLAIPKRKEGGEKKGEGYHTARNARIPGGHPHIASSYSPAAQRHKRRGKEEKKTTLLRLACSHFSSLRALAPDPRIEGGGKRGRRIS